MLLSTPNQGDWVAKLPPLELAGLPKGWCDRGPGSGVTNTTEDRV